MAGDARRCFLACFPDAAGVAALGEVCERLAPVVRGRGVRWLPAENWHVTLVFLGTLAERPVAVLIEALEQAFPHFDGIACRTRGALFLPSASRPRVFAVGLDSDGGLERTAARAAETVDAAGLTRDERPFRAHLTLARLKGGPARLEGELPEPVAFSVDRVGLYASDTGPDGARYTPVWQRVADGR